jgi:hypothetical protein
MPRIRSTQTMGMTIPSSRSTHTAPSRNIMRSRSSRTTATARSRSIILNRSRATTRSRSSSDDYALSRARNAITTPRRRIYPPPADYRLLTARRDRTHPMHTDDPDYDPYPRAAARDEHRCRTAWKNIPARQHGAHALSAIRGSLHARRRGRVGSLRSAPFEFR